MFGGKGRNYATRRRVASLNPDEVVGFFQFTNPSSRTVAIGLTHFLTEMITKNIPGSSADNIHAICQLIV
jgi:hypothetical protein